MINGNKSPDTFIKVKKSKQIENTYSLFLSNPTEKLFISLSNVDPDDPEEQFKIKDKFLVPYFYHLGEILTTADKIQEFILSVVQKVSFPSYSISIENKDDGKKIEILMQSIQKNKNDIFIEVFIKSMKVISIKTSYFESEFVIWIPTQTFIKTELNKLIKEIVVNNQRISKFTSGDEDSHKSMVIGCDNIEKAFNEVNIKNGYVFEINLEHIEDQTLGNIFFKDSDGTTYPNLQSKNQLKYSCENFGEWENDDNFIIVRIKLNEDTTFSQSFFKESLYDLNPVALSFWDEIFDNLIKLYAPQTNERIYIFKDQIHYTLANKEKSFDSKLNVMEVKGDKFKQEEFGDKNLLKHDEDAISEKLKPNEKDDDLSIGNLNEENAKTDEIIKKKIESDEESVGQNLSDENVNDDQDFTEDASYEENDIDFRTEISSESANVQDEDAKRSKSSDDQLSVIRSEDEDEGESVPNSNENSITNQSEKDGGESSTKTKSSVSIEKPDQQGQDNQ